jgi:tetraacyldisaccharide 4'-kinase
MGEYKNPYGLAMQMRRALYRSGLLKATKVSVPVISVGNLTVGGTGKTPVTKLVTQFLRDHCHKQVAIVMRGYKRDTRGLLVVSDGVTIFVDATASGDEAQLYAQELANVIVICDEERTRGAKQAIDLGANVIVLDDSYQHLAIGRDLNILLIAASETQGKLIPLGRFRETVSASQDADIILITGSEDDDYVRAERAISGFPIRSDVLIARAIQHATTMITMENKGVELDQLKGKKVLAVSAIARPERFHSSIATLGAEVVPFVLPDHNPYNEQVCTDIFTMAAEASCDLIVQTSKDAVKSAPFLRGGSIPVLVLQIEYRITNESRFFDRLRSIL